MYNQNTKRFTFDFGKAKEVLLYITKQVPDLYKALKILYFADKMHLSRYGRFINGDKYIAMRNGPVPSESYDIIKVARGDGINRFDYDIEGLFKIDGHHIKPQREADLKYLSKTDIECLDASIKENKRLSFDDIHKKSQDKAYKNSEKSNDEMSVELIASSLSNSKEILEHISNYY